MRHDVGMDRVPLSLDELVEHWTLLGDERELVAGKRGPTRLGFALILKFYAGYGRFPAGRSELSDEVIAFVAKQVKVPASRLSQFCRVEIGVVSSRFWGLRRG